MEAGSNPPPSQPQPRAIGHDVTLIAALVLFAMIFWGLRVRYWSVTHEEPSAMEKSSLSLLVIPSL